MNKHLRQDTHAGGCQEMLKHPKLLGEAQQGSQGGGVSNSDMGVLISGVGVSSNPASARPLNASTEGGVARRRS